MRSDQEGRNASTGYLPHQSLAPGLVIWKSARAEATRVVMTAKDASREVNIFQRGIFKKTERPPREGGIAAREKTGRQQGATGGARGSMKRKRSKTSFDATASHGIIRAGPSFAHKRAISIPLFFLFAGQKNASTRPSVREQTGTWERRRKWRD